MNHFLDFLGLIIILALLFGPPIVLAIWARLLWKKCCARIHLSTTIILVCVAGFLMGENLTRRDSQLDAHTMARKPTTVRTYAYGFPFRTDCMIYANQITEKSELPYDIDWSYQTLPNDDIRLVDDIAVNFVAASWNIEIGAALVLLIIYLCERRIQRLSPIPA